MVMSLPDDYVISNDKNEPKIMHFGVTQSLVKSGFWSKFGKTALQLGPLSTGFIYVKNWL